MEKAAYQVFEDAIEEIKVMKDTGTDGGFNAIAVYDRGDGKTGIYINGTDQQTIGHIAALITVFKAERADSVFTKLMLKAVLDRLSEEDADVETVLKAFIRDLGGKDELDLS